MTFAAATPEAIDYGGEAHFLQSYLDAYNVERQKAGLATADSYPDIFLEEARDAMLLDLQTALGLNPDDAADLAAIDLLVTTHPTRVRKALALRQLVEVYRAVPTPPESANARKLSRFEKAYNFERSGFPGLRVKSGRVGARTVKLYG